MPTCVIRWCSNYPNIANKAAGVTYHSFPSKEPIREKWTKIIRKQRSDPDWMPSINSRVCSQHFEEKDKYFTQKGIAKLHSTAVPVLKMSKQDARSVPSKVPETFPWQDHDSSDHEVTNDEWVPLVSRLEQCRFCGDFSNTCLYITDNKPYVNNHKTDFTLNGICVNLDFSNDYLPNTVCRHCDVKLQEIAEFVSVVKAAQDSLIIVTDDYENQENNSKESEENTIVIKIERELPTPEKVNPNDVRLFDDDTNETEVIKVAEDTIESNFNNKRKVKVYANRKPKKARVSKRQSKNEVSLDNEDGHEHDFIGEETVEIGSNRRKRPKDSKDGINEIYIEIDVKKEIIESNDVCMEEESEVSKNKD
ncbi:uncharacterized protein LOC133532185 [Cydia pomonella]|uniref:uncharacterized protein LOC133532185 n=1 Tax=Cydia pomonella TaxID=82600 RepID=UPI002ADD3D86|nr:uncharacterized protein LOC133532185 [Cydia pomonella]XP_061726721.1 uncharacterized protein LOC133532185 [Cydia pomonella]